MRREIARRKIGERQLVQGAQHYSQLLAQSQRMQDQSRRLAHQVLLAQEEERREISRQLHDEVAQILAGINVQLATLDEAAAINRRSLRQRIAQTERLVEQSVQVVHRYARKLRPALLDDLGLIAALRSYMKDLAGRKGLRIRFTAFAGVEALDNTRRTVLYRVAQEALTNVARHAHARLVTVRLHQIPDAVRLEVRDDGKSFPVDRTLASTTKQRLGLLGMRERVEMVGGDFAIESAPGKGTTVRAEIPFRGHHPGSNS
jgi:signal transduction histidine kinase